MDPAEASQLSFTPLLAEIFRQAAAPLPAKDPERAAASLLVILGLAQLRADRLSLVTPGQDVIRELSTAALRSLFIPSLRAYAEARYPTKLDLEQRQHRLEASAVTGRRFLKAVDQLRILAPGTRTLAAPFLDDAENVRDVQSRAGDYLNQAAQKRQTKIARFQTERALRKALETFRDQADASPRFRGRHTDYPSDVLYDAYFLTSRKNAGGSAAREEENDRDKDANEDEEEDEEEEEEDDGDDDEDRESPAGVPHSIRTYILMLLNLHAVQVLNELDSGAQELELLRSRRSQPPDPAQPSRSADTEWRLDSSLSSQQGPLLDPKGKPLRPFTITSDSRPAPRMSAGAGSVGGHRTDLSARQRLAAEVFRPSHRLPTMSVDEYLAEEMRRGNVITGGGPEQMAELTPREQRAIRAEMDGTLEAAEAEDEARMETLHWDEFKEQHRKGEGNTMNRG